MIGPLHTEAGVAGMTTLENLEEKLVNERRNLVSNMDAFDSPGKGLYKLVEIQQWLDAVKSASEDEKSR
jgi:hypothetical protein